VVNFVRFKISAAAPIAKSEYVEDAMSETCLPAEKITGATPKLFLDAGEAVLKEFNLKNSRCADLIARPAPLRPLANARRAHLIRQLAVTAMRRLEI
jgi:hypothetical protein